MAAPSFSSFPPSFSSFPDLDVGNSKTVDDPSSPRREEAKKRGKSKRDKGIKEWKQKREDRRHVEDPHKSKDSNNKYRDDERLKYREDVDLREIFGDSRANVAPLFYSDRKGDPLNVHYGGLHTGDIPKHHLVARESYLGRPIDV